VGTISSVKVALEDEGDIKTRKRRSLGTKTKRLFDGWTLNDVRANVKHCNIILYPYCTGRKKVKSSTDGTLFEMRAIKGSTLPRRAETRKRIIVPSSLSSSLSAQPFAMTHDRILAIICEKN